MHVSLADDVATHVPEDDEAYDGPVWLHFPHLLSRSQQVDMSISSHLPICSQQ